MILTTLVAVSIATTVLQNYFFNSLTKTKLNTPAHIKRFNVMVYVVGAVLFGILLIMERISLYTILMGAVFGLVSALGSIYKLHSLSEGPMHITLLVTTSSMIIPTMSGVFFGEAFSISKLLIVFVLIFFIYLSMQKGDDSKINKKWFLYCLIAFVFQGFVGVIQKMHQTSVHKAESAGFLFVAFICATLFSLFGNKDRNIKIPLDKKCIFVGLLCGCFTFIMNYINLKLSGILPSQLFFPLVNGSVIVLSSIMSAIVFKEKLTAKQTTGLIGGILSLIAICIVS